jgi:hypothetical protein
MPVLKAQATVSRQESSSQHRQKMAQAFERDDHEEFRRLVDDPAHQRDELLEAETSLLELFDELLSERERQPRRDSASGP